MTDQKKPQGRKAAGASVDAGYQNPHRVSLDDETVHTMRQLGAGNLSAGIRKAAGIVRTINREVNR